MVSLADRVVASMAQVTHFVHLCTRTHVHVKSRPDMNFAVDWALNNNDLSIYLHVQTVHYWALNNNDLSIYLHVQAVHGLKLVCLCHRFQ